MGELACETCRFRMRRRSSVPCKFCLLEEWSQEDFDKWFKKHSVKLPNRKKTELSLLSERARELHMTYGEYVGQFEIAKYNKIHHQ